MDGERAASTASSQNQARSTRTSQFRFHATTTTTVETVTQRMCLTSTFEEQSMIEWYQRASSHRLAMAHTTSMLLLATFSSHPTPSSSHALRTSWAALSRSSEARVRSRGSDSRSLTKGGV